MSILISFTFLTLSIFFSDISSAQLIGGTDWMNICNIKMEIVETSSTTSIGPTNKAPQQEKFLPSRWWPGDFIRVNDGPRFFVGAKDEEVIDDIVKKLEKDAFLRSDTLDHYLRSGFNDYIME